MMRLFCLLAVVTPLFAHGDLREQIERVSQQIRQQPDNLELYLQRGELYRVDGKFAAAEGDFARAASLPAVHLGRGRLYIDQKLWARAVASLDLAAESEPGLALRAEVYGQLHRYAESARDFRRALTLATDPKVEYYLGLAQALGESGRHAEAIQAIDEGLGKLGPLVTLEHWALESDARLGQWDEAFARLDRLIERSVRRESWLARKAELEFAAGRVTEARQTARAARLAWNQLPERLRRTRAMVDLDARIAKAEGVGR